MLEKRSFYKPKTPKAYLRLLFTGFAMGAADTVPGVSGGTMAFILGVYEDLVFGIRSFDPQALALAIKGRFRELLDHVPWRFLLTLGSGILLAIFTLSSLLSHLLEHHPGFVFSFFAGLILASILSIGAEIEWSPSKAAMLALSAGAAFWIVGLNPQQSASHDPLTLFASGMIAISAMILPGISGSFILLILGQYAFVLNAVRTHDWLVLAIFASGCAVGILLASRILGYLLKRYRMLTLVMLTGLMTGSLRVIWSAIRQGASRMERFGPVEALWIAVLTMAGFLLVSLLDHLASGKNPLFRRIVGLYQKKVYSKSGLC